MAIHSSVQERALCYFDAAAFPLLCHHSFWCLFLGVTHGSLSRMCTPVLLFSMSVTCWYTHILPRWIDPFYFSSWLHLKRRSFLGETVSHKPGIFVASLEPLWELSDAFTFLHLMFVWSFRSGTFLAVRK